MHCHTRIYGSVSKVKNLLNVKVTFLKGYDRMLVADMILTEGYNRWKSENPDIKFGSNKRCQMRYERCWTALYH